ncbi:DNA repair protein RecO [Patescibacteria group bacterium]
MSEFQKITAIIIKKFNIGESNQLLTVISPEEGLIKLKARGVKKISSKNSPHLQSLNYVKLNTVKGKTDLRIIAAVDCLEHYKNIKTDLSKIIFAEFLTEHYLLLVGDDVNQQNFKLLLDSLKYLNNQQKMTNSSMDLIYIWLIINILISSGRRPELYVCSQCQNKVLRNSRIIFNPKYGGIICENCQKDDRMGFEVTEYTVKLFRLLPNIDIQDLNKITLDKKTDNLKILNSYIKHYLEDIIKSEKLFNDLVQK